MLTGAGEKAFVAAQIAAMSSMTPIEGREFALKGHASLRALELAPFPVIALVNGYALAADANWRSPATGSSPPRKRSSASPKSTSASAPVSAARSGSRAWSASRWRWNWCARGRQVKADEALRIGLANHVVAPDVLVEEGLKLARMVAQKGPVAVKMSKHLVQRGRISTSPNANAMEADVFGFLCATDDKREGRAASSSSGRECAGADRPRCNPSQWLGRPRLDPGYRRSGSFGRVVM